MLDPSYEKHVADAFKSWKDAAEVLFEAQKQLGASDSEIARLQREADVLLEQAMKALRDRATLTRG